MQIPTYQELFHPVLKLASEQEITRKIATTKMADYLNLSEEERKKRLPSGGATYIRNRTGWAMTYLTKGGLIEKVAKNTYKATDKGIQFLEDYPNGFRLADLRQIEGWQEAWDEGRRRRAAIRGEREGGSPNLDPKSDSTPEELIAQATEELDQGLRAELLEHLASVDPYRFEQIVIDLLFAMGYGGSREEAAKVTQKSNDEGIDGIINEDRLGLDVIYVQAKRWQNTIGRKEIQSFVGALAGKQANKGVFITTSGFADSAVVYAKSVQQKVILMGGERLAELMIEHNIGVSTIRRIEIKRVDSDYFEE